MQNKLWFRRKKYGWGWTPCTWQGWLIIFVWFLVVLAISAFLGKNPTRYELIQHFVFIAISISVLIYICYKKGETPKWSWGEKK